MGLQICQGAGRAYKRIKDIQEEAMYVHCNAHNMNLAFQDAVSRVRRDAMKTVKELINTIRESPKRLAWFDSFRKQCQVSSCEL